ncbi:septum site-determining protein Ssd [Nocardioides sp.]|uniref:septum site-determining protein Ssd n=1 Tax=Nocardioides sp. TaxID=35761 RepID=UPI0039E39777
MTDALLITADETLLDELVRLAAAAGVTPAVAADAGGALRGWQQAAVVLVGADLVAELARLAPPRRDGVHVVGWTVPDALYREALALGAEAVVMLPASAEWLAALLSDVGDVGRARGFTVGVIAGSGGAGATTFGCALGQLAARAGPTVVIDADPLGPGVDRVLGMETHEGVRWDELARTSGRLSARSLREALPRRGDLALLTWVAGSSRELPEVAAREVLSAARRGHDTVVIDLPRSLSPTTEELLHRCDQVLVVVSCTLVGIASASRLVASLPDRSRLRLVVRGGLADEAAVAAAVGAPVLAAMSDQRGLDEAIDLGYGPLRNRRAPLGRAAAAVLEMLSVAS